MSTRKSSKKNNTHKLNEAQIIALNRMLGNWLGDRSLCDYQCDASGKVAVFRPAYQDYITLTAKELSDAQAASAYSTLNLWAAQTLRQVADNEIISAPAPQPSPLAYGFTMDQINHSHANYRAIMNSTSSAVYRVLD